MAYRSHVVAWRWNIDWAQTCQARNHGIWLYLCTHECKREVRKNQNLGFEQVGPTSKACELCFNGKLVLQEVNAKPQSIDCLIDHSMETDQATEKRKQLMGLIYFNQISVS